MEEVMDDNNYMNNDNRSSGTPDNTGVFGQSSETANGSDTYSQPQDTYNQPTDTYNQSVSQQESGYAYGQASDQTGSTDGYVNNPGSAYGYANQGTYNQNPNAQGTYNQNPNAQGTYNQNTYAQGSFNQSAYGQTQYGQQPNGQGGYNQTAYGQTAYNQPQYGANPYNKPPKNSNGFGIASLVIGIASIVLFCTCINYVTALLAIIFGIIHIIKGNNKVFGIVGIATAAFDAEHHNIHCHLTPFRRSLNTLHRKNSLTLLITNQRIELFKLNNFLSFFCRRNKITNLG
jgi:hypothetical protein